MKAYYGPMEVLYEKPGFDSSRLVSMPSFLMGEFVCYYDPNPQKTDDTAIRNPDQTSLNRILDDLMQPKGKNETPPEHNPR